MSWDASLRCVCCGHALLDVNYTSNTNGMIRTAGENDWPHDFTGLTGPEGAAYLDEVIRALRDDPARFDAMNPENGWGKRVSLLQVLNEMRDAVPEAPTRWEVQW